MKVDRLNLLREFDIRTPEGVQRFKDQLMLALCRKYLAEQWENGAEKTGAIVLSVEEVDTNEGFTLGCEVTMDGRGFRLEVQRTQ